MHCYLKIMSVYVFVFSTVLTISAQWQNPVFLTELNDYPNRYLATRPAISADENQILFVRNSQQGAYYLWQANRNPETGVFDQQRILSELNSLGGRLIFGTWLSKDSLRLYYCADDPRAVNGRWGRNLVMAIRNNPQSLWVPQKKHLELQLDQYLNCVSLTGDELHILWTTVPGEGTPPKIYTASRPSVFHNFSNIRRMYELETIEAYSLNLTSDGLMVYFCKPAFELWVARRASIDAAFDEVFPVTEVNQAGPVFGSAYPSLDGKKLYYFQAQGEVANPAAGLYAAEWKDKTYDDALRLLNESVESKEQIAGLLDMCSANEETALQILSSLSKDQIGQDVANKNILQSIQMVRMALQRQSLIKQMLTFNLQYLNTALILLMPPVIE